MAQIKMLCPGFQVRFPERTVTSHEEAEAGALQDYAAVGGKILEVTEIDVITDGCSDVLYSKEGKPFLVRVMKRQPRMDDLTRWMDDEHLDPFWDVEVVDGQGLIEPALLADGWFFIYGRGYKVLNNA